MKNKMKNVPFYVVRGNNDKEWAKDIPETLEFELNYVKFFLVHNKKDIPEDLPSVVQKICVGMDKGQTVEQMAKKMGIDPVL